MGFQASVNNAQPVGLPGDFASENPARQLIPPFGIAGGIDTANAAATDAFIAASAGVVIGNFAWIQADGISLANSPASGTAAPDGFIPRSQQGLIITQPTGITPSTDTWYGSTIPAGQNVTAFESGSFYALAGVGGATVGQKAFASLTNGSLKFAAAGATVSGYVETSFYAKYTCNASEITIISAA